MAVEFKVPELGENIDSGDVVSVLVNEGDTITANQGVVELETGKAVVEVPCPFAGKVSKVHVKAGDSVPVGATLLTVEADGEPAAAAAPAQAKPQPEAKPAPEQKPAPQAAPAAKQEAPPPQPAPAPTPAPTPAPVKAAEAPAPAAPEPRATTAPASPSTRRFARELGVELSGVSGTGPDGRITREDIAAAVRRSNEQRTQTSTPAAPPVPAAKTPPGAVDQDSWGPVRRDRLTKIRKTIAANMAKSHSTIPHVTNFDDADVTELERIRKESMEDYEGTNIKLTLMSFVLKAVAHALKLHPVINASLDFENDQITYKEYVNVGIAVDTERGLVVPVLRNVDRLGIPQIAQSLTKIAGQARAAQFSPEDLRGGTFTVSNLGAVGGTYSTPIINPPEVAVLLIGRSRKMPVVINDQLEIRLMMPLSLSYDHRIVDGAVAGRFLNEIIGFLEAPTRLLLAP